MTPRTRKVGLQPALRLEPERRSGLEDRVDAQLKASGVKYGYESVVLNFEVPARIARYTPDFPITDTTIILEAKGRFGHMGSGGAKVRQHLILAKQQNPDRDIRIVFQNAKLTIYKGSKTTYAKWADDHGFKWADKGLVPKAWIEEIKLLQGRP